LTSYLKKVSDVSTFKENIEIIINTILKIIYYLYEDNELKSSAIMNELVSTIPCTKKLLGDVRVMFKNNTKYAEMKNHLYKQLVKNCNIFSSKKFNIAKLVLYNKLSIYRFVCTKTYFHNLLIYIYSTYLAIFNRRQKGGLFEFSGLVQDIIIKTKKCKGTITTSDFKILFDYFKNMSANDVKDIILNDITQYDGNDIHIKFKRTMTILYIYKYIINFIFKVIIENICGKESNFYNIVEFIDSCITFFIALYLLSLEKIISKCIDYIDGFITDSNLKRIINVLLKTIFNHTNMDIDLQDCDAFD